MIRAGAVLLAALLPVAASSAACDRGPARPAGIQRDVDACASCRMVISDTRTAAQVAVPGQEPRFYDDPVCLRRGLRADAPLPARALVFIVDHRTGEWEPAADAVFVRLPGVETPMASHWVAYADESSRRLDPQTEGAEALPAAAFLAAGDEEEVRR